jgi:hypothetical protein
VTGGERLADTNRQSAVRRIRRFARTAFTFFAGTLIAGIFVELAFSASACAWNGHVRCFSIARDTLGLISSAAETWFLLAIAVAFLTALMEQIYRAVAWWSALVVAPVSILAVCILPYGLSGLFSGVIFDPIAFLAVGLVLFVGYQFSLFISKLGGLQQ